MTFNNTVPVETEPADTIVARRFERRAVTLNCEYDHRNLGEVLKQVELDSEGNADSSAKAR